MNKKLKNCTMLFVLAAHIPSLGMFTVHALPSRSFSFKSKTVLQSPAIRSYIGLYMYEQRNKELEATKLIEFPQKPSIFLFPKDMIFFYGVSKELRPTCKYMEALILPSNLERVRMLCENSSHMKSWSSISHIDFKAEKDLLDAFAFSALINDAKNYEILYKKLDIALQGFKYLVYKKMIGQQIFNDREGTVRALLRQDPMALNNACVDRSSLLDDIDKTFYQRCFFWSPYHSHDVDKNKYMNLLIECGCKPYLTILRDEREAIRQSASNSNKICTLF